MSELQQLIYNKYIKLLDGLGQGRILPYSHLYNACILEKSKIESPLLKEYFTNKLTY